MQISNIWINYGKISVYTINVASLSGIDPFIQVENGSPKAIKADRQEGRGPSRQSVI